MATEVGCCPTARGTRPWRRLAASLGPAGATPLAVLFGLNLVDEFDRVAFGALAPEIRDTFGLANSSFVTISAASLGLSLLLAVPVGRLADRGDRVRLSRFAALCWCVSAVVVGVAPAVAVLVLARFTGGVGRLVNEPVHPSLLTDYYPGEQLPRVFGIHRFANSLGLLAGPAAGLLVGVLGSWRPVFVLLALPTLALALASRRLVEPPRVHPHGIPTGDPFPATEAFRRLRGVRTLRRTWLAAFFFGSGVLPFATFLSLYFEDVYEVGAVGRGALQALFGLGGAVGLVLGARWCSRAVAERRPGDLPLIAATFIIEFAVGIAAMALAPGLVLSSLFVAVLAVGASGFLPAYLTMVALAAPTEIRSQAFAYSLLFFALGGITLSRVTAVVGDTHGQRPGMVLLSMLVALGGGIGLTVRHFADRDLAVSEHRMDRG